MLRQGGAARVFEIVDAPLPSLLVADAAEIDEGVRILVTKKRRKIPVFVAVIVRPVRVFEIFRPGRGVDRVGRRTKGQQVEQHGLVEAVPVVIEITRFGFPAHTHQWRAHQHGIPLHTPVKFFREIADFGFFGIFAVEIPLGEKGAAEQQGGVDGRQFDLLEALSRFHVEKVVIKTLMATGAGRRRPVRGPIKKTQGGQRKRGRLLTRQITPFGTDSPGGEGKTHRRDTRKRRRRRPIRHQTVLPIHRLVKIKEAAPRKVLEQLGFLRRRQGRRRKGRQRTSRRSRGGVSGQRGRGKFFRSGRPGELETPDGGPCYEGQKHDDRALFAAESPPATACPLPK